MACISSILCDSFFFAGKSVIIFINICSHHSSLLQSFCDTSSLFVKQQSCCSVGTSASPGNPCDDSSRETKAPEHRKAVIPSWSGRQGPDSDHNDRDVFYSKQEGTEQMRGQSRVGDEHARIQRV